MQIAKVTHFLRFLLQYFIPLQIQVDDHLSCMCIFSPLLTIWWVFFCKFHFPWFANKIEMFNSMKWNDQWSTLLSLGFLFCLFDFFLLYTKKNKIKQIEDMIFNQRMKEYCMKCCIITFLSLYYSLFLDLWNRRFDE